MNRISHQYSLWEEAQNEFRNYQEMYRTAEGLARSIGLETSIMSNDLIFPPPKSNQELIDHISQLIDKIKSLLGEILESSESTRDEIQKLKLQSIDSTNYFKDLLEQVNLENKDALTIQVRRIDLAKREAATQNFMLKLFFSTIIFLLFFSIIILPIIGWLKR